MLSNNHVQLIKAVNHTTVH